MERKIKILAAIMLAAGISASAFAQQKPASKSKISSSYSSSSKASSKSSIGTVSQASDDTLFIKRALAIGVAEIEFAQVALQNSSSEKIKNLAQKMIEDHTSANNKLMAIMNGTSDESNTVSSTPTSDNSTAMGTGSGTNTGVGSGEKAGVDSSGTVVNRQVDSTGVTSGGIGSTTGNRSDSTSVKSSTSASTDSSTNITSDRTSVAQQPAPPVAKPAMELKLSGAYLDIKNKMEALSGTVLDRQYVQQAVKDHSLTVKLLEKYQQEGSNPTLKAWVKEQLPIVRKHKAESTKLSASLGGTAKKSSKG